MKKHIIPAALAIAVFIATIYLQRFTILRQEGLGLFLNIPDFYRALFFDPFPLSNLIGSFLVQFYSNFYVGAAIVAALVLLEYVILRAITKHFGLDMVFPAVIGACTAWFFVAKASNPSMGVAIILCSLAVLAILTIFIRRKPERHKAHPVLEYTVSILIIATAVSAIGFNRSIKEGEKWSKIEFAAIQGEWDYLLKVASPKEAERDIQVVPYALLALNAQGRLVDGIEEYPVHENFGLDFGDEVSYRRSLFDAVLYSNLGCHNESIHRTHQCGDFLPHCTSFRTLRMLVKENYALGDSLLVVKYCDILDKSLSHKEFTEYFRKNPCPRRPLNTPEESASAQLITTKYPDEMLLRLGRAGITSNMAIERYYAYFKVHGYFKTLDMQQIMEQY